MKMPIWASSTALYLLLGASAFGAVAGGSAGAFYGHKQKVDPVYEPVKVEKTEMRYRPKTVFENENYTPNRGETIWKIIKEKYNLNDQNEIYHQIMKFVSDNSQHAHLKEDFDGDRIPDMWRDDREYVFRNVPKTIQEEYQATVTKPDGTPEYVNKIGKDGKPESKIINADKVKPPKKLEYSAKFGGAGILLGLLGGFAFLGYNAREAMRGYETNRRKNDNKKDKNGNGGKGGKSSPPTDKNQAKPEREFGTTPLDAYERHGREAESTGKENLFNSLWHWTTRLFSGNKEQTNVDDLTKSLYEADYSILGLGKPKPIAAKSKNERDEHAKDENVKTYSAIDSYSDSNGSRGSVAYELDEDLIDLIRDYLNGNYGEDKIYRSFHDLIAKSGMPSESEFLDATAQYLTICDRTQLGYIPWDIHLAEKTGDLEKIDRIVKKYRSKGLSRIKEQILKETHFDIGEAELNVIVTTQYLTEISNNKGGTWFSRKKKLDKFVASLQKMNASDIRREINQKREKGEVRYLMKMDHENFAAFLFVLSQNHLNSEAAEFAKEKGGDYYYVAASYYEAAGQNQAASKARQLAEIKS